MKKVELMEAVDREFGLNGSFFELAKDYNHEFGKDDFVCYLHYGGIIAGFIKDEIDRFFNDAEGHCCFYDLNFEFRGHYRLLERCSRRVSQYELTNELVGKIIVLMDDMMELMSNRY